MLGVVFGFLGPADNVVDDLGRTVVTAVELGMSVGGVNVVSWLVGVVSIVLSGGMVVLMVLATEIEIVATVLPATFFALQL